tara:strand:+ start:2932 stop:3210 length:279 start_codon:yes stop_codon:yes gene_type:complete
MGTLLLAVMLLSKIGDLHAFFHLKNDGKAQHCELCILSQKQHHNNELLLPSILEFEPLPTLVSNEGLQPLAVHQFIKKSIEGKYYNKPPPVV